MEDEEADEPESIPAGWQAAVADPDWGERVVAALRAQMRDPERLLEPAVLVDAWSERDPDGVHVLRAIYDHPYWPQRTGLRMRLDEPPFDWPRANQDLAAWLAGNIADEVAEPLGRMYDLLVPDEHGVHWWGHGYRHISEHPDFEGDMRGGCAVRNRVGGKRDPLAGTGLPVARRTAYAPHVIEVGQRRRNQPAPPWAVHDALTEPGRDPERLWLKLAVDEQAPRVVEGVRPDLVVWSSLWPQRADALIRFDLPADAEGQGTDLTWTLLVEEPEPHEALLGHLRRRINVLINAELRYSFGH